MYQCKSLRLLYPLSRWNYLFLAFTDNYKYHKITLETFMTGEI